MGAVVPRVREGGRVRYGSVYGSYTGPYTLGAVVPRVREGAWRLLRSTWPWGEGMQGEGLRVRMRCWRGRISLGLDTFKERTVGGKGLNPLVVSFRGTGQEIIHDRLL